MSPTPTPVLLSGIPMWTFICIFFELHFPPLSELSGTHTVKYAICLCMLLLFNLLVFCILMKLLPRLLVFSLKTQLHQADCYTRKHRSQKKGVGHSQSTDGWKDFLHYQIFFKSS